MINRIGLAVAIFIIVGLLLVYLFGPLLLAVVGIPFLAIVGGFFVTWGWLLAFAAGLYSFFSGQTWPIRR